LRPATFPVSKIDTFREEFPGRAEMIEYCRVHKIPVEASLKKPYSMDRNLLHISYEAGILEDPWFDPTTKANKAMFKLSVAPEDAPNKPEYVEIDFVKGNAVAVNGQKLTPGGVLKALNKLGGKHGIGRVDLVENRFVGMKSRGGYETPGGPILMPSVDAFVVTPVSAHSLTHRPLVVRDSSEIEIVVKTGEDEAYLSVDGQIGMPMLDGDRVLCRKSQHHVTLLHTQGTFFDVLRTKLKWGQR